MCSRYDLPLASASMTVVRTLGTKIIRGPQLLLSTAVRVANGEIAPRDLRNWVLWQIARRRTPPVLRRAEDHADGTVLLDAAGFRFWWPAEFPHDNLNVVWAEVFVPFPPNGHAYEHGPCRLAPRKWIIDAGACEGFFVSYALNRGARVLAIEPVGRLAYCLRKTFEAEVRVGTLIVLHALVGATAGSAFIRVAGSPVGARASGSEGEPVAGTTIDALLDAAVIPNVAFIKMDIEGAEVSALSGARSTLRRHCPALSIAVYHNAGDERQVKDMIASSGAEYDMRAKGLIRNRGRLVHQLLHAWPKEKLSAPRLD